MEENAAVATPPSPRQERLLRIGATFLILWAPFLLLSSDSGHPVPVGSMAVSVLVFALPTLLLDQAMKGPEYKRQAFLFAIIFGLFLNIQVAWFDGLLFGVGVLVLSGVFWLLRAHLPTILLVGMATTMLSAWIMPTGTDVLGEIPIPIDSSPTSDSGTGLFLHLILDEMVGPAGIPDDVPGSAAYREELDAFLERFDFTVLPRSHSQHASSKDSMAAFLNLESTASPHRYFKGKRPYILSHSAYFEWLAAERGPFHVLQSDYMDFCAESPVPLASCTRYQHGSLGWLRNVDLGIVDEFSVVFGVYVNSRGVLEFLGKRMRDLRGVLAEVGFAPPRLLHWDGILAPANGHAAFTRLEDAVVNGPPDATYFAHIILPHSPYMVDERCRPLPDPFSWKSHTPRFEKENSADERVVRYQLYWDQARCATRLFTRLLERLEASGRLPKATIVVQGDHGSRISQLSAHARNRDAFSTRDFWDSFGALFAYRSPGLPDLRQDTPTPLSRALADFARSVSTGESASLLPPSPARIEARPRSSPLTAFLVGKDDEDRIPVTVPDL